MRSEQEIQELLHQTLKTVDYNRGLTDGLQWVLQTEQTKQDPQQQAPAPLKKGDSIRFIGQDTVWTIVAIHDDNTATVTLDGVESTITLAEDIERVIPKQESMGS